MGLGAKSSYNRVLKATRKGKNFKSRTVSLRGPMAAGIPTDASIPEKEIKILPVL